MYTFFLRTALPAQVFSDLPHAPTELRPITTKINKIEASCAACVGKGTKRLPALTPVVPLLTDPRVDGLVHNRVFRYLNRDTCGGSFARKRIFFMHQYYAAVDSGIVVPGFHFCDFLLLYSTVIYFTASPLLRVILLDVLAQHRANSPEFC